MKNHALTGILCLLFILFLIPVFPAAAQESPIRVEVDRLNVSFDEPPQVTGGRTLVPFRALSEAMGVSVTWDPSTRQVLAQNRNTTVLLTVDSTRALVNGREVTLDQPARIQGGRALIPLRFFGEAFDAAVHWDPDARRIAISTPPLPMTVIGFYALGSSAASSWTDLFGTPWPEAGSGRTHLVDELALGWYGLDATGGLTTSTRSGWSRPSSWQDVLTAAALHNLRTEMTVHETDRDGLLRNLLSNDLAVRRAVEEITAEASLHYSGVNLDLEGLGWRETGETLEATRQRFTGFVSRLSESLRARGLTLTLTLHPLNSGYPGYDYAALGALADRIIVMAHDYGGRPEPDARVEEAIVQAKALVPASRLILGISLPTETPESLVARAGLVRRHNLAGISLWRLGLGTNDTWHVLESRIVSRATP